jgi:hypothetical protein
MESSECGCKSSEMIVNQMEKDPVEGLSGTK